MLGKSGNSDRTVSAASQIRHKIETEGQELWTFEDFEPLPLTAVAKALSRLVQEGLLERAGKGIYYRPRETVFGKSQLPANEISETSSRHTLHPTGISAANILGFTTQNPSLPQYATTGPFKPTKLSKNRVYTRRPASRDSLTLEEGALLEFLRARAALSELSPKDTARKLVKLLTDRKTFKRIAEASLSEPPRVRAILGAIGEEARQPEPVLAPLRTSLNPLTKFDFGPLNVLQHAKNWQAK